MYQMVSNLCAKPYSVSLILLKVKPVLPMAYEARHALSTPIISLTSPPHYWGPLSLNSSPLDSLTSLAHRNSSTLQPLSLAVLSEENILSHPSSSLTSFRSSPQCHVLSDPHPDRTPYIPPATATPIYLGFHFVFLPQHLPLGHTLEHVLITYDLAILTPLVARMTISRGQEHASIPGSEAA